MFKRSSTSRYPIQTPILTLELVTRFHLTMEFDFPALIEIRKSLLFGFVERSMSLLVERSIAELRV